MRKGFTLVELSIVLIIIGLIIGGVMKGTDLINSAKQKKVYNTWLKEWQVVINMYQDRTGKVLADGEANGGTTGAVEDGAMDGIDLNATSTVQDRLKEIGLKLPTSNVASSGAYRIEGKNVTSEAVVTLGKDTTSGKNVIKISDLPTDVAVAFDTISDGELGQGSGSFKWDGNTSLQWPDAETTTKVDVMLEL